MLGLPYESWSWFRILMIVIVKFHPVRVGVLDTLNCAPTFSLNMQKHSCAIFLKDKK
jgi:hypothetical protein